MAKNKRLKIAVLLAGNLRTFEETAPFLKKYLLDLYDSDVFIYTPNQIEHNEQAWHNITGKKHNSDDTTRQELTEKANHLYSPTKLVISDDYKKINTTGVWRYPKKIESGIQETALTGPYRMFFNWKEVNKLWQAHAKQAKVNYDFVVFIRPDVMLLEPLTLEPYQEFFDFNKKTIIFFCGDRFIEQNQLTIGLLHSSSDRIILAKPDAMNIFLNIFNHFDRYFKLAPQLPFPTWIRCCFENMQHVYAIEQGLYPIFGKINYALKRMNKKDDQVFIFPDRLNYYAKTISKHFRRIMIREKYRWARQYIVNAIIFICFINPPMNKIWQFYKFIKQKIKK